MDTSKSVFVLHGVDAAEKVVLRKKLRRQQVIEFFGKLKPTKIGLEACGAAHYWARARSFGPRSCSAAAAICEAVREAG
jgi:transposase